MSKFLILSVLSVFSSAYLSAQALLNKGALYVGGTGTTSLYVKGDLKLVGANATVAHPGKSVLTGDFINDVSGAANHAFTTPTGTFVFKGSAAQKIRGSSTSHITFPKIEIDNQSTSDQTSTVTIDPAIDVEVSNLTFTRGRLVLDSKATKATNDYRTTIAGLKVTGTVTYKHNQTPNRALEGMVQVNLALGAGSWEEGRLIAFSSPFKKMYADYFLFNFLSDPATTASTIQSVDVFSTRMDDKWIKDPKTPLTAGKGFLLGMGLVTPWSNNYYQNTLAPQYSSAVRDNAARDSFVFARFLAPASFRTFVGSAGSTLSDSIAGEELNTTDVSVTLNQGYQFVGNPFTTPLDMGELTTSSPTSWGTSLGLEAGYFVLTAGTGKRLSSGRFSFSNTFTRVASTGGTEVRDTLPPMQAFVVNKTTSGTSTFKIPASKRVFRDAGRNPSFWRSAPEPPVDELLIETKDLSTGGFDRLCVVFRKNASRTADDIYDALKLFNRSGGVNQIYTRSSDNKDMVSNIMPSSTEQLVMYFEPSAEAQEVRLTASRLNTISSVPNVVLEDRQTGRVVDLKQAPTYHFLSSPNDKIDRFILHFGSGAPVGGIGDFSSPLFYAAYEAGTLWVHGIKETWTTGSGSSLLMYDMLGRLVHSQKIAEAPSLRIAKYLPKGVYVLRVTAENASAAKFIVK